MRGRRPRGAPGPSALRLGALSLAVASCQWVAGIDSKQVVAVPRCGEALAEGGARVRVGNLVPGAGTAAFCLQREGGQGAVRLPSDQGCFDRLAFAEVSAAARVEPGLYTVRSSGDGDPCAGAAVASGVQLAEGSSTTVARLGGAGEPERLLVLPESPAPSGMSQLRFVHAAPGAPALALGIADGAGVPARLTTPIFRPLPFGASSASDADAPWSAPLDERGYTLMLPLSYFIGGGPPTSDAASFATRVDPPLLNRRSLTLYAVARGDGATPGVAPLLCDETDEHDGRTACASGPASEIAVEVYDAFLGGPLSPHGAERREPLLDAVAREDTDALCIQQLWIDPDKTDLIDRARERFPHALWYPYTNDTQPSDPRDLSGLVPEPPPGPPCQGDEVLAAVNAGIDCMRDKCSLDPADGDQGYISDVACAVGSCGATLQPLAKLDPSRRCSYCLLAQFSDQNFGQLRTACTASSWPLGFSGRSGSLLLSRLPFEQSEGVVFPATTARADGLRARVRLPNGVPLDLYCAYLVPKPAAAFAGFYVGLYGSGAQGEQAWENEGLLETQRLIEWVRLRTGEGKAALMGDVGAGPEQLAPDGSALAEAIDLPRFDLLQKAFPLAAPSEPTCTACPENPLVTSGRPGWTTHVFLPGLLPSSQLSFERRLQEPVVQIPGSGTPLPLSPHYAVRVRLRVSP